MTKPTREAKKVFEKLFIEDETIISAMRYFVHSSKDATIASEEFDKIKKGQDKLWQWINKNFKPKQIIKGEEE